MTPETPESQDRQLIEMNEQWFILDDGGSLSVCRWLRDEAAGRERLARYSFTDFLRKYETRPHYASGKALGEAWQKWPARKQYDRVVFRPDGQVPPDALNLWRGFGVEPRPGAYPRIEEHLFDVVCGGDTKLYDYLIGWMARMVQRPAEAGEVAVVLRGKEGVGKSVVGLLLRRLLGQHALAVSSGKHLLGDFNAHLQDVVFLEASEAMFAGDKAAASKLKAMITDSTIMLERKGGDAIGWPNFLHVLMTSNDDWVVPAGAESRRYFVLDVSEKHRGDTAYFADLFREIGDNAEAGAFLHELLAKDLSTFNHRAVPSTDALRDQRIRSATGVVAWGLDLAERGCVVRTGAGKMPWRRFFTTQELHADYAEWASGAAQKFERPLPLNIFARDLQSKLGLSQLRRAPARVPGIPELARGSRGFVVPDTATEWAQLVRKAGGIDAPESEEEGEGAAGEQLH